MCVYHVICNLHLKLYYVFSLSLSPSLPLSLPPAARVADAVIKAKPRVGDELLKEGKK